MEHCKKILSNQKRVAELRLVGQSMLQVVEETASEDREIYVVRLPQAPDAHAVRALTAAGVRRAADPSGRTFVGLATKERIVPLATRLGGTLTRVNDPETQHVGEVATDENMVPDVEIAGAPENSSAQHEQADENNGVLAGCDAEGTGGSLAAGELSQIASEHAAPVREPSSTTSLRLPPSPLPRPRPMERPRSSEVSIGAASSTLHASASRDTGGAEWHDDVNLLR
ncbi:hypothetical protein GCM10011322_27410 [Salinarimonas ramus]|uniref:Uncharacterized protein n=2 Tax=Salinarimonas ramus TaxID=690164 RepID=A0A917Q9R5_9HYPH|nr:hypothetical protein GCM10011322_27410 [Salinarimonas ramus]